VLEKNSELVQSELNRFLKSKLPEYMIPVAYIILTQIPLTATGKVDRITLEKYELMRPDINTKFVAPRDSTEERIAEIWRELLEVDRVGVLDNFFALGGHSLLATQVMSRLRDEFQVEVPLQRLFDTPTIEELAAAVAEHSTEFETDEEIKQLLDELGDMSPEEVEQLLAQRENQ
jgi:acyl carrier protein